MISKATFTKQSGVVYINEMYGVKEIELLWWERQGKTNKEKRAGRTFEETKKVASRSKWHG
jgi:hypothetical protein